MSAVTDLVEQADDTLIQILAMRAGITYGEDADITDPVFEPVQFSPPPTLLVFDGVEWATYSTPDRALDVYGLLACLPDCVSFDDGFDLHAIAVSSVGHARHVRGGVINFAAPPLRVRATVALTPRLEYAVALYVKGQRIVNQPATFLDDPLGAAMVKALWSL